MIKYEAQHDAYSTGLGLMFYWYNNKNGVVINDIGVVLVNKYTVAYIHTSKYKMCHMYAQICSEMSLQ
jgi:hypothetical protein